MSTKRKQPKTVVRSKEELLTELRGNAQWVERMRFIKAEFWPALCDASTSIEDATILVSGFNTQIMQEFLARMKEVKIAELNLDTKLDTTSAKYEENKKLVALFQDMNVFEAKELIEGMQHEIETFKVDEMRSRSLDTLETKWLDE